MLILSRHREEKVIITAGVYTIEVMVVEMRGDKVRLGFTAHDDVTIHREEIQARIDREGSGRT
jgi:carbon storage regulator